MRISRLYADNFRCLVNFEIRLEPLQLLVGGNGTGKSTLFDVIDVLRAFISDQKPTDELFLGDSKTRWQQAQVQRFEIDAEDGQAIYKYQLVVEEGSRRQAAKVRSERLLLDGQTLFELSSGQVHLYNDYNDSHNPGPRVSFPFEGKTSGLGIVSPRQDNTKLTKFKDWIERLRPVQIDPWEISERSKTEVRFPSRRLDDLASWYRHLVLEDGEAVNAAIDDLREAVPGFRGLSAKAAGREYREVIASFHVSNSPTLELALTELSDGQRCLIGLYLLLHTQLVSGPGLLLDEPENFIALREIQPWLLRAIDKAEETGAQLIIASHHPEVLNQLAARGAVVLTRDDGGPTRVKPFPDTDGMTAGQIVAAGWEDA